ncbi:hypothetical protein Sjap_007919 [Stephania japonica]|uniref:Uncharacterized protein n=1 Tax=Stephania japonica TaxID=461633 RepID=A0AAP0JQR6_9MAGN
MLLMCFLSLMEQSSFRTNDGISFHTIGVILAIVVPITFAILWLSFSSYVMSRYCSILQAYKGSAE